MYRRALMSAADAILRSAATFRRKVEPVMTEPRPMRFHILKDARTRIPSRHGLVLVYQPAQDVPAEEASPGIVRALCAIRPLRRLEPQAAVRPVPVVVGGEGTQDEFEMP